MTLSTILLVAACNLNMVYSHYEHVPTKGWERNDTISFDVSPLEISGNYQEKVGLRITGEYPFMGLTLIVDQTAVKSGKNYRDTLNCKLIDHNGNVKGQGVSHYQYEFKLATIPLEAEDSLHITIRHDMKREMLPGITDIGVTLIRQ
jgi:gliding motility-associated lipoprotein GldH